MRQNTYLKYLNRQRIEEPKNTLFGPQRFFPAASQYWLNWFFPDYVLNWQNFWIWGNPCSHAFTFAMPTVKTLNGDLFFKGSEIFRQLKEELDAQNQTNKTKSLLRKVSKKIRQAITKIYIVLYFSFLICKSIRYIFSNIFIKVFFPLEP